MSATSGIGQFVPDYNNKNVNNPQNIINTDAKVAGDVKENTAAGVRKKETEGVQECETCKNRRYQDGSNDPGVSFKTPTKIGPGSAAGAVRSHEQEHVTRNAAKAQREDKEVISSTVNIFTAVCPECGRSYVSGGETRTVTATKNKQDKEDNENQRRPSSGRLELSI